MLVTPLYRHGGHVSRERILVVDDEEIVRDVITEILGHDGFAAVGVASGAQALAELDKGPFKLMITDVMMPGMNGIELITAARKKRPELEAVVISGHGTAATKDKLDMLGVFGYLDKPIRSIDLISVAREAVKSNRLERLGCGKSDAQVKLSRERVLVADDDPAMQDLLYTNLSKHGYSVTTVGDGERAHELLLINDYDLVILDINMPRMNGVEAVKVIREFDPYTWIMLISGESRKHEIDAGMKNGANLFLAKPFTSATILEMISKINFDRIRKQKRAHIEKGKSDAGRSYGLLRRFLSVHFWIRFLRSTVVEFLVIGALGLGIGALALYLSGEERGAGDQDSILEKAKMMQQYMSQDQINEMRKSYKK
jgi:CheY-like chemotaxis protein